MEEENEERTEATPEEGEIEEAVEDVGLGDSPEDAADSNEQGEDQN